MSKVPEKLTPELLGLVVDKVITDIKRRTVDDRVIYTSYTLPTIKYKSRHVKTVIGVMKNWILEQGADTVLSGVEDGAYYSCHVDHYGLSKYTQYFRFHDTELGAVTEAVHWVAKKEGLL